MSQSDVRKIVMGSNAAFGGRWWYDYSALPRVAEDEAIIAFVNHVRRLVTREHATWNDEKTSEWCIRNYTAARLILGATVLARSLAFAEQRNLRMLLPHGYYYLCLAGLRSIVITSPLCQGSLSDVLQMSHAKTINIATDVLRRLDRELGERIEAQVRRLKALRELIDYRAPTSGYPERTPLDSCDLASVAFEVAQLQSEIRESGLQKLGAKRVRLLHKHRILAIEHEIEGITFRDDDDRYRTSYLDRKEGFPINIQSMISAGHVDDVLGGWGPEEDDGDQFNPDKTKVELFDLP